MRHVLMTGIILLVAATGMQAGEAEFCETLQRVLTSAEARNGFAEIVGANTGTYHETLAELPKAQFCVVYPDDHPTASWRCLATSEGKYNFALQAYGTLVARVKTCLGSAWADRKIQSAEFLRETRFASEESPAGVRVVLSQQVRSFKAWREHRVVISVHSPRED